VKKYSLAFLVVFIFSLCGQTFVDLATQAKNVNLYSCAPANNWAPVSVAPLTPSLLNL
jgi:hypothetical protein